MDDPFAATCANESPGGEFGERVDHEGEDMGPKMDEWDANTGNHSDESTGKTMTVYPRSCAYEETVFDGEVRNTSARDV